MAGEVVIDVPRDREGTFEPQVVKKRQRRLRAVDEMVLSLYAKGLTTARCLSWLRAMSLRYQPSLGSSTLVVRGRLPRLDSGGSEVRRVLQPLGSDADECPRSPSRSGHAGAFCCGRSRARQAKLSVWRIGKRLQQAGTYRAEEVQTQNRKFSFGKRFMLLEHGFGYIGRWVADVLQILFCRNSKSRYLLTATSGIIALFMDERSPSLGRIRLFGG